MPLISAWRRSQGVMKWKKAMCADAGFVRKGALKVGKPGRYFIGC